SPASSPSIRFRGGLGRDCGALSEKDDPFALLGTATAERTSRVVEFSDLDGPQTGGGQRLFRLVPFIGAFHVLFVEVFPARVFAFATAKEGQNERREAGVRFEPTAVGAKEVVAIGGDQSGVAPTLGETAARVEVEDEVSAFDERRRDATE